MKAIETRYKGYRFRSRLEARWAVFFDAMGLEWEYEPEGYDLGKLGWYLPDFRLTQSFDGHVRTKWVEIKGKSPTAKELEKMFTLVQHTNTDGWDFQDGLIVWGDPYNHEAISFCGATNTYNLIRKNPDRSDDHGIHLAFTFSSEPLEASDSEIKQAVKAATAAREARFEHGQTPR